MLLLLLAEARSCHPGIGNLLCLLEQWPSAKSRWGKGLTWLEGAARRARTNGFPGSLELPIVVAVPCIQVDRPRASGPAGRVEP